ncbi:MAG: hypothetical protein OEU95_00705 [Nitrospirota bacterium]|nr:hypothetical protein [Nitrospirota bacterium]
MARPLRIQNDGGQVFDFRIMKITFIKTTTIKDLTPSSYACPSRRRHTYNIEREFMKFLITFALSVFLLITSGCATTINSFNRIPVEPSEFRQTRDGLDMQYPDIKKYEKRFLEWNSNTPPARDLIEKWGEPNYKKIEASYPLSMGGILAVGAIAAGPVPSLITGVTVVAIRPYIPEYYYWRKGDYCIETYIDKTIEHGYKKRLLYWKWYDLRTMDEVPKECKHQT